MKKQFNITGNCFAHIHYMMDNSQKVAKVYDLVEYGHYFCITRPRQYGKTTTLFAIEEKLWQLTDYLPIRLNFQGIDHKWHKSDTSFAKMFIAECIKFLEYNAPEIATFLKDRVVRITSLNELSTIITELVNFSKKKIVVLIDEVDASSNYMPFLTFLGMLRTKYLDRYSRHNYTFHSVVLVGVHDVKSLKYKIRNQDEAQYNSPWNIALDFKYAMEFNPQEIAPMLAEYAQAEKVEMNIAEIAEKLYAYTGGYPFLVSRLCQIVAQDILPKKTAATNQWEIADVEQAVYLIQTEVNTNFESLIKNLENHADLQELVSDILVEGEIVPFNPHNSSIHKGILYGIFRQNGSTKIHNYIYQQIIYNYLLTKVRETAPKATVENQFILPNNVLNFEFILQRFQAYMKEHYHTKDLAFLEREWRLIFMAFIRPILNGTGHTFVEPEISEERRLDVVVTYYNMKYIVELKRWNGQEAHERGLLQLHDYLEKQALHTGFLVVFDHRRQQVWQQEWREINGKRIFAIWL
jgi:hypothetical protein